MARLEVFDSKEPSAAGRAGTRRLARTVVRLSDCTSVAPVGEGGPRAGTATFRLETRDRTFLFAAEKEQSEEWVAKLCQIAFPVSPRGAGGGDGTGASLCVCVSPFTQGRTPFGSPSGPGFKAPCPGTPVPSRWLLLWFVGLLRVLSIIRGCGS